MKMKNKILIFLFIILNIISIQNVNATVSDRELALASALTYIPTFCTQKQIKNGKCSLGNTPSVVQFFNSYVNVHNYGTADELKDWKLVDYTEEETSITNSKLDRKFSGYTFQKGNDVIILFRGTDFIDLFEWIQHLSYGLTNVHAQETHAEKYILSQAAKYKDCNIYITGHSLGGYLTDVAAATLLKAKANAEKGNTQWDWEGFNLYSKPLGKKVYNINDFKISDYKNINFVRSASFNGMGFLFDINTTNIENNIQQKKIDIIKNNKSKIIEYGIKGDLVSSLGLRVGEIRVLDAPLDSVTFHRNNYGLIKKPINDIKNLIDDSVLTSYLKKENENYTGTNANAITTFTNVLESKALNLIDNYTRNDIKDTYNYYELNTLIGYVHLTHESDGFICLLNNEAMNNAKLRVYQSKNVLLAHGDYIGKANNDIIPIKSTGNTQLRAMTSGACARKYEWYSCTDATASNCTLIKTNELSSNALNNKNDISDNINVTNSLKYYKVKSYINDNYKKAEIIENGSNYKYINSNETKNHEMTLEKVFGVVSDSEAPKCIANINKFEIKKGCTENIKISCTDNVGIQNDKITTSNVSGLLKNNIDLSINDKERNNNTKSMSMYVTLTGKTITLGTQKIQIKVSDIVGNTTIVTIKGDIDSNLFNKKCD